MAAQTSPRWESPGGRRCKSWFSVSSKNELVLAAETSTALAQGLPVAALTQAQSAAGAARPGGPRLSWKTHVRAVGGREEHCSGDAASADGSRRPEQSQQPQLCKAAAWGAALLSLQHCGQCEAPPGGGSRLQRVGRLLHKRNLLPFHVGSRHFICITFASFS